MCSGTYRYHSHQIYRERPRITDARMGSHLLLSDSPAGEIMNTVAETVLCHLVIRVDEILHLRRGGGQRMRRDIKPLLSLIREGSIPLLLLIRGDNKPSLPFIRGDIKPMLPLIRGGSNPLLFLIRGDNKPLLLLIREALLPLIRGDIKPLIFLIRWGIKSLLLLIRILSHNDPTCPQAGFTQIYGMMTIPLS